MLFSNNLMVLKNIKVLAGEKQYKKTNCPLLTFNLSTCKFKFDYQLVALNHSPEKGSAGRKN
jgi:hypothetical protein